MEKIRYSEDVKESILLASKLARKEKKPTVQDRDYLRGLLMTHRMFNRLDGILKELNLSIGEIQKQLRKSWSRDNSAPEPIQISGQSKNLLETASHFVQNGRHDIKPTVDVEHMLKALCCSPDPVVRRIIEQNKLTPERIDQSLERMHHKSFGRHLLFFGKELAEVVLFVLIFLVLIKSFLGELRLIPSESMVPALKVEDRVVIERLTHWFRPYERGDILVFYPPMTELKNDPWSVFLRLTGFSGLVYKKEDYLDVAYIKRLIGLPGDTVEVRPNVGVFVNGELLDEPYVKEIANSCTLVSPVPICDSVKIPEGHYYLMGDNRNQSADSRYWGFESENRVIGRAVFRIWPPERMGILPATPYQKTP